MSEIWFYRFYSRISRLGFRAKIMVLAFIGTHVPLLAIVAYFTISGTQNWRDAIEPMLVALVATLVGTAFTLFVLVHLLRPIILTGKAMRAYATDRIIPNLPTWFTDEAGQLMADAQFSIEGLEERLRRIEHFDSKTGLYNREGLIAQAEMLRGMRVAALHIHNAADVAAGFDLGVLDAVMTTIAARLTRVVSSNATIARVGEGAFIVVFPDPDDVAESQVLQRQIEVLSRPIEVGPESIRPDLRVGMSV